MDKNRTIIKISGREYTMMGTEPVSYLKRVGAYVDRKIQEIHLASGLNEPRLTVLTALNLADELFKAQEEVNRLRREMNELRREIALLRRTQRQEETK